MGYSKPTPIQLEAIPAVLQGKDLLASAQTGTGKTAAFAVPLLHKLSEVKKAGIRALVLAPTRELAMQIDEQFWSIGYHTGVTTASVYGGTDWGSQEQAIRDGVNVLVATPGRLLDHIRVNKIDFSQLEFLVLDEADRMLDMGFIPDVKTIISKLPKERQTLMFSATLSPKVESLARELTRNPVRINISTFKTAEGIKQVAYKVAEEHKLELVLHLFDTEEVASAIVFTGTKRGADSLGRALKRKGVKVNSMHGDRDQKQREETLAEFKSGRINVIVATDVMARGIDITGVSHVINFDVPRDLDDYIHRIGRTARAEKTGTAITLVSGQDERYFQTIFQGIGDKLTVNSLPDRLKSSRDLQHDGSPNPSNRQSSQDSASRRNKRSGNPRNRSTRGKSDTESHLSNAQERAPRNAETSTGQRGNTTDGSPSTRQEMNQAPGTSNDKNPQRNSDNRNTRKSDNRNRGAKGVSRRQPRESDKNRNPSQNRQNQATDHRKSNGVASQEQRRQDLIKQVSNPLSNRKLTPADSENSGSKGIWGKIKNLFGSKK